MERRKRRDGSGAGRRVPVGDAGALVALLGRLEQCVPGTQEEHAARLGTSQGNYSSYRRGRVPPTVSGTFYQALRERLNEIAADREQAAQFFDGVTNPDSELSRVFLNEAAREHLDRHRAWLDGYRVAGAPSPAHVGFDGWAEPFLRTIRADPSTRRLLEDFERQAEKLGWRWQTPEQPIPPDGPAVKGRGPADVWPARWHAHPRYWLAILRVLEPILGGWETRGMERTMEELAATGELASYFRAAFRRELILLRRETDRLRAQRLAADPLHAFPEQRRWRERARVAAKRKTGKKTAKRGGGRRLKKR